MRFQHWAAGAGRHVGLGTSIGPILEWGIECREA